jgi:serine/threonine-protein kinase HipA
VTPFDVGEVRTVNSADVWKKGTRVARLVRAPDAVEFGYLPEHVRAGTPAVATTLPVSPTPVRTPAGAVPPFFAGLLPEGRRLTSLRRAVKTSADDELSLLLAVGRDTVGDVQVVPEGEAPDAPAPLVTVDRDWSALRFADLLADAGIVDPVALAGVQDKVSARVLSLPVARAHERYLLKLDPPEFKHVVVNEAYFLELARDVRMPCVSAAVVRDADGRAGLLVRRFDRVSGPRGGLAPLACEDGCQVLGRWPADKYGLTTEEVVKGLARWCGAEAVALRALYRQVCFAWLTGNGDLHAKNLSILEGPGGEWEVAPAYDLPATVPHGDSTLALPVQGKTRGLSRKHLLDFAADVGLPRAAAEAVLDDLLDRTSGLEDRLRAGALPFAQKTIADWTAELRNRRRQAAA